MAATDDASRGGLRPGRSALQALTRAALVLPAFAGAAEAPTETELSLAYSNYQEDDAPEAAVVAGDDGRYDIDIYQFALRAPVGAHWSIGVLANREVMSGASPWGAAQDFANPDGAPLLIMTGPTIGEQRNEYRLDVSRYFASASVTLGLGHSTEDDYQSNSVSVAAEFELQQAMTTLSVGASYSNDDLAPTDAAEFGRVPDASKTSRSFSLGVTRVLNRHAVLQASTSVTRWSGFLSDPYKLRDVRPDRRTAGTLGLRYRQFIPAAQAALHADYRFYADDYNVRAHSLEIRWHQNLGSRWQLVPRLRYHSQSDAEFFTPADDFSRPIAESQSSDARLSAFGALSGGVTLGYRRESWGAKFTVERYAADSDRGLSGGGPDLPGLVNFTLLSFGVDMRL